MTKDPAFFSTDAKADALWAYCVDIYGHADVAAHCLRLQDSYGLDVNIILLLAWMNGCGWPRLMHQDVARLVRTSQLWQKEIIGPLRQLRQQIKGACQANAPGIYESVKSSELEAERAEQIALIGALDDLSVKPSCQKTDSDPQRLYDNLVTYGQVLGIGTDPPLLQELRGFISAVSPR